MAFENWNIQTIAEILPEELFNLIEKNRNHISKTFPVTVSSCENFEKTIQYLGEAIENQEKEESYYFYLRNLETGILIGFVMIKNLNKKIRKCELAYFVDQDFEGKGIISKAVVQTISFCFRELMMNKIFICTSKINFGSQKIATKNGFQQEGILREEFKNGEGVLEDIVYFGLLKSDYYER
ncbi:ribosomal-protein-amino-adic N-acetyltransferase [Flavobacterium noncentrifugens]|uniref:Acetyltransferase (GNAT) domain-containing protein n=1 Tax=Flavobacterium noncentrifugens TaxID=1128970 RepID=A0A1G8T5L0_9FLAO|nr:GNAT family protein [Flavobacterium noncentrifugens]GEP50094.1 ribosomal-protein-amino-adic N-acetyltransferase [Flavobacterium noncentrifugens]SDJ36651.1 Acetyltransferase (GNAT) domain-containing protein [Flavobacterium noncentrifugens]